MWKMMAQKIETNENYLYNCSLPMYYDVESIAHNKEINDSHFRWFNVWFFTSLTCIVVALTTFKSKLLKDIHPSQLIGVMSVFFMMTNWHIFIWKLGEAHMVCYVGVDSFLQSLTRLFGGSITSE
jgi:EamA domain-containing membrane protein RarD